MPKLVAEELVYVGTEDGFILEGAVIRPVRVASLPVAVVCIHGFTSKFYHPFLIRVARRLGSHGVTSISGNNRGHDVGAMLLTKESRLVEVGSLWERFEKSPLDIAAWIEFTISLGFRHVALFGHSLGATKAIFYQAKRQDPRVLCVLAISGPVRRTISEKFSSIAEKLVAEGRGEELMPPEPWSLPEPPSPLGPVSAQTFLSWARSNQDVFGLHTPTPSISMIRCPLFVCYGTEEPDVGTPKDLEMIQRNAAAASQVECRMFEGANHRYEGHEEELADAIVEWLKNLLPRSVSPQ